MKAIMVMFDSLNRRMLPPYGCDWTRAPNFTRLAERTVTFDNAYIGSMPCIPARRELHTGRCNFLHRSWGPLEPFDDSMPELLKKNGTHTHLVTDHQHYWEDGGATYHNRYTTYEFVRGQEGDRWKGQLKDPDIPKSINGTGRYFSELARQDWVNRSYMPTEQDQPLAKTVELGLEFIRTNHGEDNWFLQIEGFDPHEPFFTQQKYKDLYPHEYEGPHFDWPPYNRVAETPEQVQHVRYEYAALLSMCDAYLGKVLDLMDEYNLWEDTMLIVNTDHGFLLGEHDWWAKVIQPWYQENAHIPLFIWDPRSKRANEHCQSLVQTIDLAPTLLEFFGVERPVDMAGVSLQDTIASDEPVREYALFGIHGGHVNITDGHYVYMRAPANEQNVPLYEYTLMPSHMRSIFSVAELQNIQLQDPFAFTRGCRTMKIARRMPIDFYRYGTLLFDVEANPQQQQPINDPEIEQRMIENMVHLMQKNDAPSEQYERLGLMEYVEVENPR